MNAQSLLSAFVAVPLSLVGCAGDPGSRGGAAGSSGMAAGGTGQAGAGGGAGSAPALAGAGGASGSAAQSGTGGGSGTSAESGCGQSQFDISELPPNMLILLDRSGSMDGDAGGDTRWNVAKAAIAAVTSAFDDEIRFGLATYSACLPGGCSAGSVVVPIAANNAAAVDAFLATTVDERSSDGQETDGAGKSRYLCDSGDPETSTGESLAALVGEASLLDTTRTNAVVLLTDGEESEECADDCDGPCGAQALLAQSPSVKTYVIGLGVNADAIGAIAVAGDTERAIEADNQAELSNAFDQIAAAVASCDYTLDSAPPDPAELYVFFDDDPQQIARDAADGFSYEPATRRLQFNGSACDAVKSGAVGDIDVVYGCAQPIVD